MAGYIEKAFIQELLHQLDIVELIGSAIPLKKAGAEYTALCPFHQEKTPSFYVNGRKQMYYCFGCQTGGNGLDFLMRHTNLDFVSAVEELADHMGMEIRYEQGSEQGSESPPSNDLFELLKQVTAYFCAQLQNNDQAVQAYLRQRGLQPETVERFQIGWAPPGWDGLCKSFGKTQSSRDMLLALGLIKQSDGDKLYDAFRGRLMFPIHDTRGRPIGFGGRVIDSEQQPKYLNSPESKLFQKRRELYGLHLACANRPRQLYVVEGYMDVVALAQGGVPNAVATLGTAATANHMRKLLRSCPSLVFCFDGDTAGRKAAMRAMDSVLPLLQGEREVSFRFLPEGEDPDSFIRKHGRAAFLEEDGHMSLSEYLLEVISADLDLSTLEQRAEMIRRAARVAEIPEGPLRQLLCAEIGRRVGLGVEEMINELRQVPAQRRATRPSRIVAPGQAKDNLMKMAATFLVIHPELGANLDFDEIAREFDLPGSDFLVETVRFIHGTPECHSAQVVERWRETRYERRVRELLQADTELYATENFAETFERLRSKNSKEERRRIIERLAGKGLQGMSEKERAQLRKMWH
ncbi:MAG: DNA primase [Candidatus Eutrophobiaceae bacterium]